MGQPNSKGKRETDDSEKETEKKILCQMQKLIKKNEKEQNQRFRSEDRADQETTQTEKRAEIKGPSSGCSTNFETEYRTYGKDKTNSYSDEAVDKGAAFLGGADNGEYVYLHSNPLNRTTCIGSALAESLCPDTSVRKNTENHFFRKDSQHSSKNDTKHGTTIKENKKAEKIKPKACIHVEEEDINPEFIDIQVRITYITFERGTNFGTYEEQVHKESPAQKVRELDRTNSEKLERGKDGNTNYAPVEKLTNRVKSIEARSNEEKDKHDQLSTAGTTTLHDLNKWVCICRFLDEDLIRLNENVFRKLLADFIHNLKINSLKYSVNRPAYLPVYAIAFKGGSVLLQAFEDKQIIKYILRTQNLREMYLGDEHFRLATFSLSVFNHGLGEIIRLAGSGFFCDADGSVKCFCCGNTYTSRSELLNSHHPDCASRTSDGHVGRSIADHYGEFAPGRLVPSGQNVQEEYRTQAFIDIHIRMTTSSYRLGGTEQFVQDDALAQENELNDSAIEFSVREGPTHSRQETPHGANIDVSVLGNCLRNMGIQHENQRMCVSTHEHGDERSLEQANVGEQLNSGRRTSKTDLNRGSSKGLPSIEQAHWKQALTIGRRTIKEDVNRGSYNDTARLVQENERLRSGTLCCKCKIKRRNIVFIPCGHLVVCDQCVSNTTVCPECGKKVDEAHVVCD